MPQALRARSLSHVQGPTNDVIEHASTSYEENILIYFYKYNCQTIWLVFITNLVNEPFYIGFGLGVPCVDSVAISTGQNPIKTIKPFTIP